MDDRFISRRRFLELAGATGVSLALARTTAAAGRGLARWSRPATWGGRVPGRRDVAIIDRPVLLDVNARVAGVVIRRSGRLVFPSGADRKLTSTGNVVVTGRLVMRPRSAKIEHRIEFAQIEESRVVGGGHKVLKSDVGLWVMHHGKVEIAGSPKEPWARAATGVAAGAASIDLDRDPRGWRVDDEVVITPTRSVSGDHHDEFDRRRVAAVDGRTIGLDSPTSFDHPSVAIEGSTFTAEVLNLTRNVGIGGTPGGRAHVFIHSAHLQRIKHAVLRHVGPRRGRVGVLGRYGLHFHEGYSGSRGSTVEGVVVRDCGNHSFVPHTSHGVSFTECIAYDVLESPFWWDEGDRTDDTTWDRCVAARVDTDNDSGAHELSGFFLGKGTGNSVVGSVATGIRGVKTAAGFMWPPEPMNGVWNFEDCIAHNNRQNGIFVWQLNGDPNVIDRFTGYNNGGYGIQHGSFQNSFDYAGGLLFGNALAGLALHANSHAGGVTGLRFRNMLFDAAGAGYAIEVRGHLTPPQEPAQFIECQLAGAGASAILVRETGDFPSLQDYVRCGVGASLRDLEPADFEIAFMSSGGKIRVQKQDDASAYQIDHTGEVTPIPPFATPD